MFIKSGRTSKVLIACINNHEVIGYKGSIPFKSDLNYFRKTTTGNVVIMGRKTFETLPIKPLPKRKNIVVSRSAGNFDGADLTCATLEDAISMSEKVWEDKTIYIAGGAEIYKYAMNNYLCNKIVLTINTTCTFNDEESIKFPDIPDRYAFEDMVMDGIFMRRTYMLLPF